MTVAKYAEKKPTMKITFPPSPDTVMVVAIVATDQKRNQLYIPKTSNFDSSHAWIPGFSMDGDKDTHY